MVSCERASQKLSNGVSCFGVAPVFPGEVQNCTSAEIAMVYHFTQINMNRIEVRFQKMVNRAGFLVFLRHSRADLFKTIDNSSLCSCTTFSKLVAILKNSFLF